jgi:hypothetical protein
LVTFEILGQLNWIYPDPVFSAAEVDHHLLLLLG